MCNCIYEVNEELKQKGYELVWRFVEGKNGSVSVATCIAIQKIGTDGTRRRDRRYLIGKYCPFCGELLSKGAEEDAK